MLVEAGRLDDAVERHERGHHEPHARKGSRPVGAPGLQWSHDHDGAGRPTDDRAGGRRVDHRPAEADHV
jgi:hypothetical protein